MHFSFCMQNTNVSRTSSYIPPINLLNGALHTFHCNSKSNIRSFSTKILCALSISGVVFGFDTLIYQFITERVFSFFFWRNRQYITRQLSLCAKNVKIHFRRRNAILYLFKILLYLECCEEDNWKNKESWN